MKKIALLMPFLATPAAYSATLIPDFTNDSGASPRVAAYDPNGLTNLNTTNWTQTSGNAGASHTFRYDISSFNLGTASELLVTASIPTGGNLRSAAGNGISVDGGANANWWDPTDNVAISFNVSIRDASDVDITPGFTVDLTGVGMRWESGAIASFAGTSATSTAGTDFLQAVSLPTGQTAESSFVFDQRSGSNIAQVQQLRLEVAPIPEPSASLLGLLGAAGLLLRRRRY